MKEAWHQTKLNSTVYKPLQPPLFPAIITREGQSANPSELFFFQKFQEKEIQRGNKKGIFLGQFIHKFGFLFYGKACILISIHLFCFVVFSSLWSFFPGIGYLFWGFVCKISVYLQICFGACERFLYCMHGVSLLISCYGFVILEGNTLMASLRFVGFFYFVSCHLVLVDCFVVWLLRKLRKIWDLKYSILRLRFVA